MSAAPENHSTPLPPQLKTAGPVELVPPEPPGAGPAATSPPHGLSRRRLALAFAIAGISDAVSFGTALLPPVQWGVDILTAGLLFAVLGWRWMLLCAFVAEAIPGIAIFPAWVLVVASVAAFGSVKVPLR